jgi:hypothetical protein
MTNEERLDYHRRYPEGYLVAPGRYWNALRKYGYVEVYEQSNFRNKSLFGFQKKFPGHEVILARMKLAGAVSKPATPKAGPAQEK